MSTYSNDFEHVMTTTRSVRKRLDFDRQIDFEVIEECMKIALQAPTGGHAEDWRWIFVTDLEIKSKIAKIYRENFDGFVRKQSQAENSMTFVNGPKSFDITTTKGPVNYYEIDGIKLMMPMEMYNNYEENMFHRQSDIETSKLEIAATSP